MRSNAHSTLWSTLFFALLGLVWCGYMAFPTASPPPCATSGCALFRDTKFAGLSLWGVGGAYFFLLAILCLRGSRRLARPLALLALLADAVLLLVMFLTAPCFDCLVAALFIGLCYYTLRVGGDGWFQEKPGPSVLLPIWLGLFLGNAVLAGNEMLPLHRMGGAEKAEVRIFFSPSCPACREALIAFGDRAALYPVLENEGDMDNILRLEAFYASGMPMAEALSRSLDPDEAVPFLSLPDRLLLDLQLLRNKAALMRQGFRALPLIQINGMPGRKTTSLERPVGPGRRDSQEAAHATPKAPPLPATPDQAASAPATGALTPLEGGPEAAAGSGNATAYPLDHGLGPVSGNATQNFAPEGTMTPEPYVGTGIETLPDFLDEGGLRRCGGDAPEPCD